MTSSAKPLLTATPSWREWGTALLVYPLAAGMFSALISLGLDRIWPSFLSDDFAANRVRMGVIFVIALAMLWGWTVLVNRKHRQRAGRPGAATRAVCTLPDSARPAPLH